MNVHRIQDDAPSWGDVDDLDTDDNGVDSAGDPLSADADLDFFEAPRRSRLVPLVVAGVCVVGSLVGVVFASATVADDAWSWVQTLDLSELRPVQDGLDGLDWIAPSVPAVAAAPAMTEVAPHPALPPAPAVAVEPVAAPPAEVPSAPTAVEQPPSEVTTSRAAARPQPLASNVARVDEVVVSADAASRVTVKCGGKSATGTSSVRLAAFPAGFCSVEVVWFDDTYRMGMQVEQPQNMQCALVEGVLRCS